VAGTATAVSGRVARHQAEKFADKDQAIMANRAQGWEQGAEQQYAQSAPAPPPPPPAAAQPDMVTQLKQLAELRDQGILTDDEFAAQKAKLLAG
jgi:hypothetical protein